MVLNYIWVFVLIILIASLINSPSSINPNGIKAYASESSLVVSINGLMVSKSNYESKFNVPLEPTNWKVSLTKLGSGFPVNPGYNLIFNNQPGKGNYFCISSKVKPNIYIKTTLEGVQTSIGYESFLNENCGSLSNMASATDLNTLSKLSLTVYTGD